MLHFFYTYHQLPPVQTPGATAFHIFSAEKFRQKVIPFSHLYITSNPYLRKIKKSLGEAHADKLILMNEAQTDAVFAHHAFPQELQSLGENAVASIQAQSADKHEINIIVVNGIGTGFGDNYVGLGAMQRLQKLLAPVKVNFHLMQSMNQRAAPIFMRESNVFLLNNCVKLKKFLQMDFYVNLTGMLGFPEFEQMPLVRFMAHTFAVDSSDVAELQPQLALDPFKRQSIQQWLSDRFQQSTAPVVLFHPQASSPVRSMQKKYADVMIHALIAHGFHVITAIPYGFSAKEFACLETLSNDIDDLLHIAACCDAVISVGTVLYHLSAALEKPTVLLPSVQADVDSGRVLPTVKPWVPKASESLIINKHKSREEEDLSIAEQIWQNIDPVEVCQYLLTQMPTISAEENEG